MTDKNNTFVFQRKCFKVSNSGVSRVAMLLFSDNVIQIVRLPRETDGCVPHACKAVGFQGGWVLYDTHFCVILVLWKK